MRKAYNRGSFYPDSCKNLKEMIDGFNLLLKDALRDKTILSIKPKAIISPHAGYIYSGFTANIAHQILANSKPKRVIVVGPSHHVYFEGVSIALSDYYETPCGNLLIDSEYSELLKSRFDLVTVSNVHYLEHSTETQMPFIRYYLPEAKVIELVYGKVDYRVLLEILKFILSDPLNVVVISSDLSHFYSLEDAKKLDNICLAGVAQKSVEVLDRGCEACGIIGIKSIVELARESSLKIKLLDYRTSADATGDTKRVVGYMSAVIY